MNILQTTFYSIPIVIENFTASAHITYYAQITPLPYMRLLTILIRKQGTMLERVSRMKEYLHDKSTEGDKDHVCSFYGDGLTLFVLAPFYFQKWYRLETESHFHPKTD